MFDRVLNTPLHWISTAFIWITTFLKTECLMLNLMLFSRYRSSRPEVFCKKVFLKFSQNSQENTCVRVSFLIKFNKVVKKETLAQVFSCEFCEIFKNSFFAEDLQMTASAVNFFHKKISITDIRQGFKYTPGVTLSKF